MVSKRVQKVGVHIDIDMIETRKGFETQGYVAECTKCGHIYESYGVNERSKTRCLTKMREECPQGETNFYVEIAENAKPA